MCLVAQQQPTLGTAHRQADGTGSDAGLTEPAAGSHLQRLGQQNVLQHPSMPPGSRLMAAATSLFKPILSMRAAMLPAHLTQHVDAGLVALVACCAVLLGTWCHTLAAAATPATATPATATAEEAAACSVLVPFERLKLLQLCAALLAAFQLGRLQRMDLSGLMQRRLTATTELLYDMMPRHVADALLSDKEADAEASAKSFTHKQSGLGADASTLNESFDRKMLAIGSMSRRRRSLDVPRRTAWLATTEEQGRRPAASEAANDSSADEEFIACGRSSRPPPRRQVQGLLGDATTSHGGNPSTDRATEMSGRTKTRSARRCISLSERSHRVASMASQDSSGPGNSQPERMSFTTLLREAHSLGRMSLQSACSLAAGLTTSQSQLPCLEEDLVVDTPGIFPLEAQSSLLEKSHRATHGGTMRHSHGTDPHLQRHDSADTHARWSMPSRDDCVFSSSDRGSGAQAMDHASQHSYGKMRSGFRMSRAGSSRAPVSGEQPPSPTVSSPALTPPRGWVPNLPGIRTRQGHDSAEQPASPSMCGTTPVPLLSPITVQSHLAQRLSLDAGLIQSVDSFSPKARNAASAVRRHSQMQPAGPAFALGSSGSASGSPRIRTAQHVAMAEAHDNVTVLFADICGFTEFARAVEPNQTFAMLNKLFHCFEGFLKWFPDIEKLDLIGDCFMAAAGLNNAQHIHHPRGHLASADVCSSPRVVSTADASSHAASMLTFAQAILAEAQNHVLPGTGQVVQLRVGVHTGPLISGLVGSVRRKYTIIGSTVNTASRLESSGVPGCIHFSEETYRLVAHLPQFCFAQQRVTELKGIGTMLTRLFVPCFETSDNEHTSQSLVQDCPTIERVEGWYGSMDGRHSPSGHTVALPVQQLLLDASVTAAYRSSKPVLEDNRLVASVQHTARWSSASEQASHQHIGAASHTTASTRHLESANSVPSEPLWSSITGLLADTNLLGCEVPTVGGGPAEITVAAACTDHASAKQVTARLTADSCTVDSQAVGYAGANPPFARNSPDQPFLRTATPTTTASASGPSQASAVAAGLEQHSVGEGSQASSSKGAKLCRKLLQGLASAFD